MAATAYVTHPDYLLHTLDGHPEHAGRIERVWQVVDESPIAGDLLRLTPEPASDEQLRRVHYKGHIDNVARAALQGPLRLDPDTYVLPVSDRVARLSAGGAIRAVDAVLRGEAANALAAIRPPGHHATPYRSMGFCLYNNVAVAARYAQAQYPETIERVMIVDYDVHHGNGTQDAFYEDPSVLFVSTHQYPFYPGTGALSEIGSGEGRGTTINMPLPAGVGGETFAELYREVLWPAARRFRPDLILVSAGFDAHWVDPLAMLQLDLRAFAALTRELIGMADTLCGGRIAFVMEGGYDLEALSHGVLNVAHALLGQDAISDPIGDLDVPARTSGDLLDSLLDLHGLR